MSCDTALIRIACPADRVFGFMADPGQLSIWSFGTWRTAIDSSGIVRGTSIRDGSEIHVKIVAHADQMLIDYHVGVARTSLSPRLFVRVIPEAVFADGLGTGLSMTALRTAEMSNERWASLVALHKAELEIIKSALETGYDHRAA